MKIHKNNSEYYQGSCIEFGELLEATRIKDIKKKKREVFKDFIWALGFIFVFLKEIIVFGSLSVLVSILIIIMDVITFALCVKVTTMDISSIKVLKSTKYQIETIEMPVYIKFWAKEEVDNLTTYSYVLQIDPNIINFAPSYLYLMNNYHEISYKTNQRLELREQAKYCATVKLPVCHKGTGDHCEIIYINHVFSVRIPEIDLVIDLTDQGN